MSVELCVVDKETGELLPAGTQSLSEIANEVCGLLERRQADAWEIGRLLSVARVRCESRDCGIDGPNPDARFGAWVSDNLSDTDQRTLHRYRLLFEVFGDRRDEVADIPQAALYLLAAPSANKVRDEVLAELPEAPSVKQVSDTIKQKRADIVQQRNGIVAGDRGSTVDDLVSLVAEGRKFGCIYADPPWQYGNQATRASTGNHYSGLSVDQLAGLPVRDLAEDNAHLHLWTTNAFLFDCARIMEAWGFTYKSCFVWVKPQMGMGNYWRVSHEFMLFGIKGKAPFGSHSEMSWGQFGRTIHSAKPEEIRAKLERVSPGPYLEMFGRRQVIGWTVWGNQISRDLLT